jgi:hypothetical protein
MDRVVAMRKVLACLRLAKSSNPNEAAAALRQARSLMDQHGLTEDDAAAAEIGEFAAVTRNRGEMLPRSVLWLAEVVANGYRCQPVVVCSHTVTENLRRAGKTEVKFFGAHADAQVAAYAFTVLNRQLTSDRVRHTSRIRKRANRDRRGEQFAFGWVLAVRALFPAAELTADRAAAIAAAIRRAGPTTKTSGREIGKTGRSSPNDLDSGYRAGRAARLRNGLGESQQRKLTELL